MTGVVLKKYEESGGWVAVTFFTFFVAMIVLMGYAGHQQKVAMRAECESKGGEFVWRPHSESLCIPKGQVIPLSMN